jgi:O-antigen/teichoic acid export membrane protein
MPESRHLRWSYLSTLTTAVMQLLAAATITRFLQPADYGLAALAILCASLAGYFTQLGVGRALIQKTEVTRGNIRAAFTLAMATGTGGCLLLAALSPLLSRYFREPRLTPIIAAFGLNLVFQSAGLVPGGLLRREFRIRDLALCDFFAYLLSTFCIGLPLAIHGFGVWALVGSNVSQQLIASIAYFVARPHSVLPTFVPANYEHIASFSGKATITSAIEAFGGTLDLSIMGRLVGAAPIGLYGRSLTLSTQPCYQASMGLTRVFTPSLARAAERSVREGVAMLLTSERQLMSLIFPMCAAAAVAAPTIIPVVFGKQWVAAIPVYRVLCVVAALDSSFDLPATQLEIANQFRYKMLLQGGFAVLFGICILLLAPHFGVLAVASAYAVLQLARSLIFHYLSAKSLSVSAWLLLSSWTPGLVCAGLVAAAVGLLQRYGSTSTPFDAVFKMATIMLVALITIVAVYRSLYRTAVFESWRAIFRVAPI